MLDGSGHGSTQGCPWAYSSATVGNRRAFGETHVLHTPRFPYELVPTHSAVGATRGRIFTPQRLQYWGSDQSMRTGPRLPRFFRL